MTEQTRKRTLAPKKQSLLCEYDGGTGVGAPDFTFPEKIKDKMTTLCAQDNSHPDEDFNQNFEDIPEKTVKSSVLIKDAGGPAAIADQLHSKYEAVVDKDGIQHLIFLGRSDETEATRQHRVDIFGSNAFVPPVIKSLWELIMENFEDQINQILLAAAVVSIAIGLLQHWPHIAEGMLEGTSIMLALTIIIVVSSGNNWLSEKKLGALVKSSAEQKVAVYRNGETQTIDYQLLVVGDVYKLEEGMKLPADSLLVEGKEVECDEADLTGEPDHKKKIVHTEHEAKDQWRGSKSTSIMYASCLCTKGGGKALVLAVGGNTVQGRAAKKASGEEEDDEKSAELRGKKEEEKQTLLQKKLNKIATTIGNLGYACAILTFSAIAIRMAVEYFGGLPCGCKNLVTCEEPDANESCVGIDFGEFGSRAYTELLGAIIIAITVIVVAIPEGLPLAVTIALSVASAIMQRQDNLVRNLKSAETMGQVTHLVSDKTGTLTKNEMSTVAVMTGNKVFEIPGNVTDAGKKALVEEAKAYLGPNWHVLEEGVLWNSDATRIEAKSEEQIKEEISNGISNPNRMGFNGNVTEMGLLKFFLALYQTDTLDDDYRALQGVRERLADEDSLASFRFNPARKMASMAVKTGDDEVTIFAKGAPDIMYTRATHVLAYEGGEAVTKEWEEVCDDVSGVAGCPEGATYREMYAQCTRNFAGRAYRTILVARKVLSMDQWDEMKEANGGFETQESMACFEEGLEVLGLFGIQDPLREAIVGSVETVNTAGISVIMCTGDNLDTAIAISKNAGIVSDALINSTEESKQFTCMEGAAFRTYVYELDKADPDYATQLASCGFGASANFSQTRFNRMIKHLRVMARSTPIDKYLLVKGLQRAPYHTHLHNDDANLCCVAVTGDGTNDAPALKKANVGFAMNVGTDVAKAASDIILLKNDFSHIVTALKYGRNIFDNIRKFLQFQLTVNVVAMFIVFFGSVILNSSPLTAVQMLWVNLIMDTFAALALATEPPDDTILLRQPQPSTEAITTQVMWRNIIGHSIYQIIVLVSVIFASQGVLLPHYDIKCIGERAADGACPPGQLNPFYAPSRYFELETQKHWTSKDALKWDAADFDKDLFVKYNCQNLRADFEAGATQEQKEALALPCTLDTVKDLATFPVDTSATRGRSTVTDTPDDVEEKAYKDRRGADGVYLPQYQGVGAPTPKLLHMTYLFQIFVFMQLFNQINARMLKEGEYNIFKGIFNNPYFVGVAILTFAVQMAMVEVGGKVTKTIALTSEQNGICALIGSGELVWGLFLKLLPLSWFQYKFLEFDEKPMSAEEESNSIKGRLRASSSHFKRTAEVKGKLDVAIQNNFRRINDQIAKNTVDDV